MNKTLLIVIGCIVVVIAAAIGGAVWWWKENADDVMGALDSAMKTGRAEGATHDEAGCLELATARHSDVANQGLMASMRNGMVLTACLDVSRPAADFCKDIPSAANPFDLAAWGQQYCAKHGFTDPYCPSLIQQVPTYCASPRRSLKLGHPPAGEPAHEPGREPAREPTKGAGDLKATAAPSSAAASHA